MEQSGTAELIRAEDGNLRYEYYIPMNDPETVLLIDAWKDQEAIDKHHASPMMQTIASLREKYDLHMSGSGSAKNRLHREKVRTPHSTRAWIFASGLILYSISSFRKI